MRPEERKQAKLGRVWWCLVLCYFPLDVIRKEKIGLVTTA
jgi:hypothetical protein